MIRTAPFDEAAVNSRTDSSSTQRERAYRKEDSSWVIPLSAPTGPPYPLTESVTPSALRPGVVSAGVHLTTFLTLRFIPEAGISSARTSRRAPSGLGSPKPAS